MPNIKTASKREKNQARLSPSEREQARARLKSIADKADVIINGYAFTREDDRIHVLNLNSPDKAVVFDADGEVLETTMDDIELSIASRYLQQNLKYMED